MKRELTNKLRFILDEFIPPIIRDSKWFMYPIFYYWFHGKFIKEIMDFKKLVYYMTEEEYIAFYKKIFNRADDRLTDMNEASIDFMISNIEEDDKSLLDIGCGRGYFLDKLKKETKIDLTGCDFYNGLQNKDIKYEYGVIEKLPFADNAFDIVTCTHTIEHIIDLGLALDELKRVAKNKVMIVTPRQKYFYYTLDLHVNFFPTKEVLNREIKLENFVCENFQGDWVYIGNTK